MTRRRFLIQASLAAGVLAIPRRLRAAATVEIPTRLLGRTGERVSSIGLGGFHLAHPAVDLPFREGPAAVQGAHEQKLHFAVRLAIADRRHLERPFVRGTHAAAFPLPAHVSR